MAVRRLTEEGIEKLTAPKGALQGFFWDSQVRYLGLCVSRPNRHGILTRTFIFQRNGKRHAIGRWPEWSVASARDQALDLIRNGNRGEGAHSQVTLAAALEDHLERLKAKRGSVRTEEDMRATFARHFAGWMGRSLSTITRTEVLNLHRSISKTGPAEANRTMRYLRAAWNSIRKEHPGLPEAPTGAITFNAEAPCDRIIEDLPLWWELTGRLSTTRRDHLRICLLTGLRSANAAGLRAQDVDFKAATLHIARTKTGKPITLPLAPPALAILRGRDMARPSLGAKESGLLFPSHGGKKPIEGRAPAKGEPGPHDARRTFSVIARKLKVDPLTRKDLLGHRRGKDVTEKHYSPEDLELMREAVERIDAEILRQVKGVVRAGLAVVVE